MKLTFSWEYTAGKLIPCCNSAVVNKDGVSLLACLLMDDGGQSCLSTIPWIDEGVAKVDALTHGESSIGNWDREAWGAKLKPNEVVIYSLHDEDYTEIVDPPAFRRALLAWGEFMQSAADVSQRREVDI